MEKFKLHQLTLLTSLIFLSLSTSYAETTNHKIIVTKDVKHDLSLPLDLAPASQFDSSFQIVPSFKTPISKTAKETVGDYALQTAPPVPTLIPLRLFQGIGVGLGSYRPRAVPPNTNGSVGPNHYVQWVNSDIGIFDKATGRIAPGFPKKGNAIWRGFGGLCETTNRGNPVVKYDQLARRWVLTQSAYSDNGNGPFSQCIAVSATDNPTGSYFRYEFNFDSFNDYGKLGLSPDGYFMTFNMFGPVSNGAKACALDRNSMLVGLPTTMHCAQLTWNQSGPLLPADLDGTAFPNNETPEYFMSFAPPNSLLLFKLKVDFNNPNNSTFAGPILLKVADFTIACPNSSDAACAIQPNTTNSLETFSDRLMHRFAFRQFSDHASMVTAHTVQGPAPKYSPALRWYELRLNPGAKDPVVYQQSTFAPDSKHRFMGSIAMDKFGTIAIGYSVSSSVVHPSIEFAYRYASDPLNSLTYYQPMVTGHGSQVNGLRKWGGYSSMSIDPVEECRFWYTNQYLMTTGDFNWSTKIISFKLGNC